LAADDGGVEAARLGAESQARVSVDVRGQPAVPAEAEVRGHDRLRSGPAPGLVHHSDRGVQYASHDYTQLLREHGIEISMSRKANPWDNAACESFIKTLKYEEVYRTEYRDLAEARASIGAFLEKVYNQKRLHSALGYLPPAEFERGWLAETNKEAAARRLSL
jgi:transposase InsO family protein